MIEPVKDVFEEIEALPSSKPAQEIDEKPEELPSGRINTSKREYEVLSKHQFRRLLLEVQHEIQDVIDETKLLHAKIKNMRIKQKELLEYYNSNLKSKGKE